MPRRKRELPARLTEETLDALVAGVRTQAEFDVMCRGLKQAITERILRAEVTEHLGYPEGEARPAETTNARNGTTPNTLRTASGALPLEIPRDRASSFVPLFVPKGVRRRPGFDQQVLSRYARGRTVRELQAHLEECYAVPDAVSPITHRPTSFHASRIAPRRFTHHASPHAVSPITHRSTPFHASRVVSSSSPYRKHRIR